MGILNLKHITLSTASYTLPNGFYEIRDIDIKFHFLLPLDVEVKISKDDIRLRSNLSTNRTIKSLKCLSSTQYYVLTNLI